MNINRNDPGTEIKRITEENIRRQLEDELMTYKDALIKGAYMHYKVDLTEGTLCNDVRYELETRTHEEPETVKKFSYDEQIEFAKKNGVVLAESETRNYFDRRIILEQFEKGHSQLEYHTYNTIDDNYNRVILLLHKNSENGHVYGTYIHYDETQQKREEAEQQKMLKEALASAERANRAKTAFLSNMSHDIRTPMSAIKGYTSLALENIDNRSRVRDYLRKIDISAGHMLSLMNDVLDMSRFEFGNLLINEKSEYVLGIIRDINDIIQGDVNIKRLNYDFSTVGISDRAVLCDSMRLRQILLNCIANAVKFTPEGGSVSFEVTESDENKDGFISYEFVIRDTGIGMSEEFIDRMFEPFTREESAVVRGIPGTGLGMSITQKLIEMMDGSISVKSEKNRGTEITIQLSFKTAEDDVVIRSEEERLQRGRYDIFSGLRILLAEDNILNREIAEELLKEKGAVVTSASNGAEAVGIILSSDAGSFELVLMDIQMPLMNGYEASRAIRRAEDPAKAEIPIIALSANAFEEDRQRSLEAGINAHVSKPVDMDELAEIIRHIKLQRA